MYNFRNLYLNLYSYFLNYYLNKLSLNISIVSFFFIWIFEWLFIFEYSLLYYTYSYLFFPYKLPLLLIVCFVYFIYIWGVSNWRRTQFGKFTRGDRKLWYKGFASFWILELSTLIGVVIAAAWMNWGPVPLFPRNFFVSRKSFIIEVTFFTYIIWILYLMRFSIKWNKYKVQIFLTSLILLFITMIIWRDILIIFGRENVTLKNSSRWKHIKTVTVIYSLLPDWWVNHFINYRNVTDKNSLFLNLNDFLKNITENKNSDIFLKDINLSDYDKYMFLPLMNNKFWLNNSLPFFYFFNLNKNYIFLNFDEYYNLNNSKYSIDSYIYYPRKIGFSTKKLAMWTFFFFLKIWHHLMLFIWWFFYLIRLTSRKKNSYSWLSICHFNVYCCFVISLIIFIFSFFPWYEMFFKVNKHKNSMISITKIFGRINWSLEYVLSLFYLFIYQSYYENSWKFLIDFHDYTMFKIVHYYYFSLDVTPEVELENLLTYMRLYVNEDMDISDARFVKNYELMY